MGVKIHNPLHPKYRSDIDGIRALAVISVVLFHAFPSLLPGGFSGVDIFFVISGFLITNIIITNLEISEFSFWDFYARRIRRIFPTLILVLIFCYLMGWSTLFSSEYKALGKHILASATFASNFALWNESGYFDTSSDLKPLLHLWSLAVEEQFYIVWPAILWVAHKTKRLLFYVLFLLFTVSFLSNIVSSNLYPIADFYLPINRFWELLVGAFLAYLSIYKKDWYGNNKTQLKNALALCGLFLIILSFCLLNKNIPFPGWYALIPTTGAAFLILSGPSSYINSKLLSNKILVFVGLISFPLYLWHWPLLSFGKIITGDNLSATATITLVTISFALAYISYKYIEAPIRKLGTKTALILITLMMSISCAGYSIYIRDGLEFRHYSALKGYGDKTPHSDEKCLNLFYLFQPDFCNMSDNVNHPKSIIIGDSIAHNLYPGILARFEGTNNSLAMVGWPGRQPWVKKKGDSNYEPIESEQMNSLLEAIAKDPSVSEIILSMNQPTSVSPSLDGQIRRTINLFKSNNKHVLYIYSPPQLNFSPISCFGMPPLRPAVNQSCIQPVNEISPNYFKIKSDLSQIFSDLNIATYDPFNSICTSKICQIKRGTVLVYRTNRYLSTQGSKIALGNLPIK